MYAPVDNKNYVGIEFIDKYHQIIEKIVNDICEEITVTRDLEKIMIIINELVDEVSSYLQSKQDCHEKHQCQSQSTAIEILRHLTSFKQTMAQFGNTLPAPIVINEIQQWVKSSVFEPDQKCRSCPHIQTSN